MLELLKELYWLGWTLAVIFFLGLLVCWVIDQAKTADEEELYA